MSPPIEPSTDVMNAALKWAKAFTTEQVPDVDSHRAFFAWVRTSPEHGRQFRISVALYSVLKRLMLKAQSIGRQPQERAHDVQCLGHESECCPMADRMWRPASLVRGRVGLDAGVPRSHRLQWLSKRAAVAFTLLGALLVCGWWWSTNRAWHSYRTPAGVERSLRLQDGSAVRLAPGTVLDIRQTRLSRDVRLSEGTATFSVRHESRRPFVVSAVGAVIEDLGTRFTVEAGQTGGHVRVHEGRVRVTGRAGDKPVELTTGQSARFWSDGRVKRTREEASPGAAAPQMTLAELADVLNRGDSGPRLVVQGKACDRRYGGFSVDDQERWIKELGKMNSLEVRHTRDRVIVRERGDTTASGSSCTSQRGSGSHGSRAPERRLN